MYKNRCSFNFSIKSARSLQRTVIVNTTSFCYCSSADDILDVLHARATEPLAKRVWQFAAKTSRNIQNTQARRTSSAQGKVWLVGAGPGDAELLTTSLMSSMHAPPNPWQNACGNLQRRHPAIFKTHRRGAHRLPREKSGW